MCGNHSLDGTPIDHEHAGRVSITNGQISYRPVAGHHDHGHHGHHGHTEAHHHEPQPRLLPTRSRRAFLGDVGKGTLAMAVVTPTLLAACGSSSTDASTAVADGGTNDSAAVDTAAPTDVPADPTAAPTNAPADTAVPTEAGAENAGGPTETLRWARANLGLDSLF